MKSKETEINHEDINSQIQQERKVKFRTVQHKKVIVESTFEENGMYMIWKRNESKIKSNVNIKLKIDYQRRRRD